MAKLIIDTTKTITLQLPDRVAKCLAEDETGIFGIEDFLGKNYLKKIGYTDLPYGLKTISIYLSTGEYLFSSVA